LLLFIIFITKLILKYNPNPLNLLKPVFLGMVLLFGKDNPEPAKLAPSHFRKLDAKPDSLTTFIARSKINCDVLIKIQLIKLSRTDLSWPKGLPPFLGK
jgi:hypothetical protein